MATASIVYYRTDGRSDCANLSGGYLQEEYRMFNLPRQTYVYRMDIPYGGVSTQRRRAVDLTAFSTLDRTVFLLRMAS